MVIVQAHLINAARISSQDDDGEMSGLEKAMFEHERNLALKEWRLNHEEAEEEERERSRLNKEEGKEEKN